jgi:parallel beta-helix repeat protein
MSTNQSGKMMIAIVLVVVIAAAGYSFLFLSGNQGNTTTTPANPSIPEILPLNQPITVKNDTDFDAQAELNNWNGTGEPGNPYIIEKLSIVNDSVCIFISNTIRNFIIRNCFLNYTAKPHVNEGAISIHNCTFGRVESCNIVSQGQGIEFFIAIECSVWNCTIEANFGLNSTESSELIFNNNRIYNCIEGVTIVGWSDIWICNNWILNGEIGITSQFTNNCTAFNNTLSGNQIGIQLYYCTNCYIWRNTVTENGNVGIILAENTHNTTLVENRIGWNEGGNALDNGFNNQWDDGFSLGNFWSDYEGTGDYPIPGSAGSVDHYPALLEREES